MKSKLTASVLALALPVLLAISHGAQASPETVDAVTAASLTVGAASITSTSAVVNYSKDKYDYGTRTLCYDPAPAVPANNCTTKTASGNAGSFTISGLKPATKYNYSIKAVDTKGGEKPYTSTGNFTTQASTSVSPPGTSLGPVPGLSAPAARVDMNGRKVPDGKGRAPARITLPGR